MTRRWRVTIYSPTSGEPVFYEDVEAATAEEAERLFFELVVDLTEPHKITVEPAPTGSKP